MEQSERLAREKERREAEFKVIDYFKMNFLLISYNNFPIKIINILNIFP